MLIYRSSVRQLAPRAHLRSLAEAVRSLALPGDAAHDAVRDLLIELGELESGIADALSATADTSSPVERLARNITTAAGEWLETSWRRSPATSQQLQDLCHDLERLSEADLPHLVMASVPEGYAYYAVYPEAYIDAASEFSPQCGSTAVSVVGLRSIGTSLSAAFVAGLRARGIAAESWTVRPRGHPFRREVSIGSSLAATWRSRADGCWCVVDEGPGISGSSLAAVTEYLKNLGIPASRIVIVSHTSPDLARLAPRVADVWRRHQVLTAPIDRLGDIPTLLAERFGATTVEDFSGGAWRSHLYEQASAYPPVHPAHERSKWRIDTADGPQLVKFAGLGRYGVAAAHRARAVAEAGFGPPILALRDGLLGQRFIDGSPLSSAACTPTLVHSIADYLAWIDRSRSTSASVDLAPAMQMVTTNVAEALGEDVAERVAGTLALDAAVLGDRPQQIVDGRLLPHEWLATAGGVLKTDAGDHGDDHFFPGPLDVAWDIAAVLAEFQWPHTARRRLIDRYTAVTRDDTIDQRLPFYRLAYLAFRTGYTALAGATLVDTEDGRRFMRTSEHYLHDLLIAARQYAARQRPRRARRA